MGCQQWHAIWVDVSSGEFSQEIGGWDVGNGWDFGGMFEETKNSK